MLIEMIVAFGNDDVGKKDTAKMTINIAVI
jgi:hypothetical protein